MNENLTNNNNLRFLTGVVVSTKMNKTIVVKTETRQNHPLFKKTITKSKKIHVHDEKNECNDGDKVLVVQTRPLSRTKRYRLKSILEQAK